MARRAVGIAVVLLLLTAAFCIGYFVAFSRLPWTEEPPSFGACGTTYYATHLTAQQWAREHNHAVPSGPGAPLRPIGNSGGWFNRHPIFATRPPLGHANEGCGELVVLRRGDGTLMVYGDVNVDYTDVG